MKRIYISSSCFKNVYYIEHLIEKVDSLKLKNIELTGNLKFQNNIKKFLIQNKNNYNFLLHNYYPIPKVPFVLNLCDTVFKNRLKSLNLIKRAIDLSSILESKHYAFHAGYLNNLRVNDLNNNLSIKLNSNHKKLRKNLFINGYKKLEVYAKKRNVNLYLENNCLTKKNIKFMNGNNLMLTNLDDYSELKKKINFKFLLDIGHLKVSSKSNKLDFFKEADVLLSKANYIHISDNNSKEDLNLGITKNSDVYKIIKNHNLKNKIITLEIKDIKNSLLESYDIISSLL